MAAIVFFVLLLVACFSLRGEAVSCPPKDGEYPVYISDEDCSKFWECSNGTPYLFDCPSGLHFNPTLNVCDWPKHAGCKGHTSIAEIEPHRSRRSIEDLKGLSCPAVDGRYPVYIPDEDCSKFWECSNGTPYLFDCPSGLHFNPTLNVCDWPKHAGCKGHTSIAEIEPHRSRRSIEDLKGLSCPAVDGRYPVYIPDEDCSKFWECSNGTPYLFDCPSGLHFNPTLNVCDWPKHAGCKGHTSIAEIESHRSRRSIEDLKGLSCPAVDGRYPVYIPDEDCSKFWECSNGTPYLFDCPSGLHFNPTLNVCDWPKHAGCKGHTSIAEIESHRSRRSIENLKGLSCPAVDGRYPVYIPDEDCSKFWECSNGTPYLFDCPSELHFNPTLNVCDWPKHAGCKGHTSIAEIEPHRSRRSIEDLKGLSCPAVDGRYPVYIPDEDCSKFWECSNGTPYLFDCPSGLHFNPTLNVCDWPKHAGCKGHTSIAEIESHRSRRSIENLKGLSCPAVDGRYPVYIPDEDCSKFWECSNGTPYLFDCPSELHFNPTLNVCDWPKHAGCKGHTSIAEIESHRSRRSIENLKGLSCPAVDGRYPVYIPDEDCSKFWECSNGTPYLFDCPSGLHFNPTLNVCDWPKHAGCKGHTSIAEIELPRSRRNIENLKGLSCPAVDGRYPVYIPDEDCSKFWECSNGTPYLFDCPSGLYFNPTLNVCDWPKHAGCKGHTSIAEIELPRSRRSLEDLKGLSCPAVDGRYPVYIPDEDCSKFWECSNGTPYLFDCPSGLHFNPTLNVCDWPSNVNCNVL